MYEEPDEDFEQHHAANSHEPKSLSSSASTVTLINGHVRNNPSPQNSEDSGASSSSRLPTIRPASRRVNGGGGRVFSPTPQDGAVARESSSSRSRPQSNPTRLLNSPYVGDITTSVYTATSRRRRDMSPTLSTSSRVASKMRSASVQRLAVPHNNSTAHHSSHSDYEPKIAEDFAQELINVKKLAQTLISDNQALKTRVKRLQDENIRRSRELEQVLEHAPDAEFAVPPGSAPAVIKRLKTRLMRMEIMLKEKEQDAFRHNSGAVDGLPPATVHPQQPSSSRSRIASVDTQLQDEIDAVRHELETAVLENKQLKQKCSMLDSWLNEKNTKLNHILEERISLQSTLSEREEALRKLRRQLALLKRRRTNKMVTIKDEPETRFFSPAPSSSAASSPGESAHVSADERDEDELNSVTKQMEADEANNNATTSESEAQSEKNSENLPSQHPASHEVTEPSVLAVMESTNGGDIVGSPVKVAQEMSPANADADDEEQREFLRNECAVKLKQVFRAHLARLELLKEIRQHNAGGTREEQNRRPAEQQKMFDDGEYSYLVKKLQALLRAHLERVRYLSSLPRV